MSEKPNKFPGIQGEIRHHGRRSMIMEDQVGLDGSILTVFVPKKLIPVESILLTVIDYLTENDPRQPEIDGYSLVRQMDPDIRVSQPSDLPSFYRSLQRLSEWGYLSNRRELQPMGNPDSERTIVKRLYRITDAGRNRLAKETSELHH